MLVKASNLSVVRPALWFCGHRSVSYHKPAKGQSYVHGASNESFLSHTIADVIRDAAQLEPDKTFIVSHHQGISATFSKLNSDANKLAHGLRSIGVKKGDRVGIWSPNCYEWAVTQFGTAKLGAVMVNVNPGYREKEFLYCCNLAGIHTLIFAERFKSSDYCSIIDNVSPGVMKNRTIVSKELPHLRNLICIPSETSTSEAPVETIRFKELLDSSSSEELIEESLTFDDAINIQFTSGTTGNPKGACLSHHNVINNAYFSGKRFLGKMAENAILCVPNPLYHCFGSVNGTLMASIYRNTVVLPAATAVASETLDAIAAHKCTIIYGTPTMYVDLLSENTNRKNLNLTTIRKGIMSGAPCPPETILRVKKDLFPNCEILSIPYGTTETSPVITMPQDNSPLKYAYDTVGQVIDHVELKIADPSSGAVLRLGESGEVMTRGFHTFVGYWNQPEKTKEVLDDRGWYHTGDIGVMNDDGYVSIVGRIKDMIIRGGENIYPREIEDFLLTYDLISDVNVCGVPDPRLGEEICAFVILRSGVDLPEDQIKQQLISYCKGKIAHFKIPKHVIFVTDFPRTVTMKVQKHKLKEIACDFLGIKQ